MAMTHRDYVAVSGVLADAHRILDDAGVPKGTAHDVLHYVTVSLADLMARDNPRFDRDRFYTAARKTD